MSLLDPQEPDWLTDDELAALLDMGLTLLVCGGLVLIACFSL